MVYPGVGAVGMEDAFYAATGGARRLVEAPAWGVVGVKGESSGGGFGGNHDQDV